MNNAAGRRGNTEPTQEPDPSFRLVGMGASAGGIRALQAFFDGMPADSGLAFVVVMHLSPDHESNLSRVLQRHTSMPVHEVTETTLVVPNHVYVIPPNKHLSMEDSAIRLVEPQQPAGKRVAIDLFFRTLSVAYGQRAVCIVFSGTDSDGSIGIKHIKEQGGVTIAQDPSDAEFDGMPTAAIATRMVDWILPAAQMPARLMEFMRNELRIHVPPEELPEQVESEPADTNSGGPLLVAQTPSETDETALTEVLQFLRSQTGHDFGHYKRATILRRVARRLQVNLLESIPNYLEYMRTHAAEIPALLHDLLISVTNFFRDPEAFAALEAQIPQLFANKSATDQVRVWVAACATGEEAYTVAILLREYADRLEAPPGIQVFASDLDEDVIEIARAGLYPTTIEADVSPERLGHYFTREDGRYRIRKKVRDTVLFSVHSLLKDSPFSRLDLITCRNLLIYLKRDAQDTVFDTFHFALRPGGLLLLGSSESVPDGQLLFAALDKRHRLYVHSSAARAGWQLPSTVGQWGGAAPARTSPQPMPSVTTALLEPSLGGYPTGALVSTRRNPLFGNLHLALLEQYAPPSLVINSDYNIVHLSEHAGRFLQFSGDASMNLLEAVHPALRTEVRAALFRTTRSQAALTATPVAVELEGTSRIVTVHVRPTPGAEPADTLILVVFELAEDTLAVEHGEQLSPEPIVRHLDDENRLLKDQLTAAVEQYEASIEEFKSANEELLAMNEETRCTAEELETSKEELQSINEELNTVNQELKSNVEELSRVNGDLQNLMASTEIGTIFLDRQLRIMRFTPQIQELFNVITTDIGRPLSDLTHKLNYPDFIADVEHVLNDNDRSEREVRSDDRWFLMHLLPYRSPDERTGGVVLTFIDITARKRDEVVLRERQAEIESLNTRLRRAMTETHHRVKNNLQIMAAFIDMKRHDGPDTVPMSELARLGGNIQALGVIHDILTQEAKTDGDTAYIPVKGVFDRFIPLLQKTLGEHRLRSQVEELYLPANQVTSLTLIANELIANGIKYGSGAVELILSAENDEATLEVRDDGPGFAPDFDPKAEGHTGLELIETIAHHDFRGRLVCGNQEQGGGRVRVTFPVRRENGSS